MVVEEAEGGAAVEEVKAAVLDSLVYPSTLAYCYARLSRWQEEKGRRYLFSCNRVLHHTQMGKLVEATQRIQVRQLGNVIVCHDEGGKIWDRLVERRLDMCDSVPCTQQCLETWGKWEVGERRNIVIGEVDRILWLYNN